MELAQDIANKDLGEIFWGYLSEAKSNLPEMGDGRQVFQRLVKARSITFDRLVNHYAISSLFDDGGKERKIYSYRMERMNHKRMEKENSLLVLGQVRVTSETIPEPKEFIFGLLSSVKGIFRTWVMECKVVFEFETLIKRGFESLGKGDEETANVLTSLLGGYIFTIRDLLKEETPVIFQKLIQEELHEHRRIYAELFDKTKKTIAALVKEGFEIPYEIRVAAEVTLSDRLLREVEELKRDFKTTMDKGEIDKIIDEARDYSFQLEMEKPTQILTGLLKEKMEILQETMVRYHSTLPEEDKLKTEKVEEVINLLDLVKKWGFRLQIEEVQDLMGEMLKEYMGALEKSWWGEGVGKPFPPNLILLAEKLNFNVERFSKMLPPVHSMTR